MMTTFQLNPEHSQTNIKKFYVYNHTTNNSVSKDYESKADAYKAMSELIYPVLKHPNYLQEDLSFILGIMIYTKR